MRETVLKGVSAIAAAFACFACGAFAAPVRIDVKAGESLVAVRDMVRAMSEEEKRSGVEIVLAPGDYLLTDGIGFTEKDSGVMDGSPVVWRSETPGAARIYGMVRMPQTAFSKVENPALLARLPEEGRGKVYAADVSALFRGDIQQIEDAFDGAPRCNGGERVFRPIVLRIASAHILADELIPFAPEAGKVFRYLYRPLCRRKKSHHDGHLSASDLRRLHKTETFLKPHFARRFIALVMDKHVAAARNLHARRSKAIKLAPVMPRL